jgi:hypothetical protein
MVYLATLVITGIRTFGAAVDRVPVGNAKTWRWCCHHNESMAKT